MLVNCPLTCDSCLPQTPAECVDKGDSSSCFLGAALGECEANPSYYLRRCAASCSEFLPDVCALQTRDLGIIASIIPIMVCTIIGEYSNKFKIVMQLDSFN
ncbi:hypothetical protein SK128_015049 [Halocaridina rubra]|uniref:ShKT domain-containing protein n=1 Tax=Halocaridina rubra TaxID=373956 RepID=A0AAN8X6P7_HALRR